MTTNRTPSPTHPGSTEPSVFVTGATGLLGSNLVRALRVDGRPVKALVRSEAKARRFLGDVDTELVVGDMRDVGSFADRLNGCGAVFHTAAYFREYYQPGDHTESLDLINVRGTLKLMAEADARGVRTFVHTSSSGAIGMKTDGTPGDEDTPPSGEQLQNGYFRSKVEGDEKIRSWTPPNGMEVIEVLPGWMWGPGDAAPTAAGQLVLDYIGRKIPVVPEGGTNVVDARDVAAAMLACLGRAHHGARFVVGGRFRTLEQILEDLEAVTGVRRPTLRVPHFAVMTFAFLEELRAKWTGRNLLVSREGIRLMRARHEVSSCRAERELAATFRPFQETVLDVVRWYSQHGFVESRYAEPAREGTRAGAQA
jgi:dihydroflavonol-4-reductase